MTCCSSCCVMLSVFFTNASEPALHNFTNSFDSIIVPVSQRDSHVFYYRSLCMLKFRPSHPSWYNHPVSARWRLGGSRLLVLWRVCVGKYGWFQGTWAREERSVGTVNLRVRHVKDRLATDIVLVDTWCSTLSNVWACALTSFSVFLLGCFKFCNWNAVDQFQFWISLTSTRSSKCYGTLAVGSSTQLWRWCGGVETKNELSVGVASECQSRWCVLQKPRASHLDMSRIQN
jgi:hypothetical protein